MRSGKKNMQKKKRHHPEEPSGQVDGLENEIIGKGNQNDKDSEDVI